MSGIWARGQRCDTVGDGPGRVNGGLSGRAGGGYHGDMTTSADHTEAVYRLAERAGFPRVGIARAEPIGRTAYVDAWLNAGCAGEMDYLKRWREIREDPRRLLPGARSVIVVAEPYGGSEKLEVGSENGPGSALSGRVARYAWGRDYHKVLRRKLKRLADELHEGMAEPFETRVCVDTAPIVEREVAAAAGMGWIGKNTMVLHRELGSFFFLGEMVTTLELEPSKPVSDHCGTCTRCLDACPTGALVAPYQMDARKCISYLTIEHRSAIAEELKPQMGSWLYGCDACQDVCPFNRKASPTIDSAYMPMDRNDVVPTADLDALIGWTETEYRETLSGSAMKRASLDMLKRNAAIARDNQSRHE